jgi:predicted transcriptional regulator
MLNILVSKDKLTINQVEFIVNESKKSQGVMFGQYNILVLNVETLNALLKNKNITFEEGQKVIDDAK